MATITLKSGREIRANGGILGLPIDKAYWERLYTGYDNEMFSHKQTWMSAAYDSDGYENECLTDEEKREVAEHMIRRWKEWGGIDAT